jgi:phage terminase large subunit
MPVTAPVPRGSHPIARCCWCGAPFVRASVVDLPVWVCPTEACRARQLAHCMMTTVKVKGEPPGERCRYVPLPRQVEAREAMDGPATFILIGGAAGGSKSRGIREIAHEYGMTIPTYRMLLLRRTFAQLEENHLRDVQLEAPGLGADFVPSAKILRYPNGSTLRFGHCETVADAANYLSSEYDLILFDELVTFEEVQFLLIASRARTTKPGVVPKVLAGTNPGGPQAHWVRSRFIDKTTDVEAFPDYVPSEWTFIPSKLEDNPYLDAGYERKLLALPAELRKAYRDGDWDIFPGQYFAEWRRTKHVVVRSIPSSAVWIRAVDGGFVQPAAILWIALFDGHAYVRHEWTPTRVLNSDQAKGIVARTQTYGILRIKYTVADTSLWTPEADTGESAAETFARHGVRLIQANKDRVNGWKRLREWLGPAPDGTPWLQVHPDCAYLARTLPALISDDTRPEDVDTDGEDHAADALRYFVMSRPAPDVRVTTTRIPAGSPADIMRKLRQTATRGMGRVA